jgi:hypothetical protein
MLMNGRENMSHLAELDSYLAVIGYKHLAPTELRFAIISC